VSDRARRLIGAALVTAALTGAGAAAGGVSASPVPERSEWYGWDFTGTRCLARSTNQGEVVFARFGVNMFVHNGGPGNHWASNMRVRIRLVSPNAGLDLDSAWRTYRYPAQGELEQDRNYNYPFRELDSNPLGAGRDWNVQVKLIWDRKVPFRDIVKKFEFPLRRCPEGDPTGPPIGIPGS